MDFWTVIERNVNPWEKELIHSGLPTRPIKLRGIDTGEYAIVNDLEIAQDGNRWDAAERALIRGIGDLVWIDGKIYFEAKNSNGESMDVYLEVRSSIQGSCKHREFIATCAPGIQDATDIDDYDCIEIMELSGWHIIMLTEKGRRLDSSLGHSWYGCIGNKPGLLIDMLDVENEESDLCTMMKWCLCNPI